MAVDKNICRKVQGKAEKGNTCLQTPGTCESCPEWGGMINRKNCINHDKRYMAWHQRPYRLHRGQRVCRACQERDFCSVCGGKLHRQNRKKGGGAHAVCQPQQVHPGTVRHEYWQMFVVMVRVAEGVWFRPCRAVYPYGYAVVAYETKQDAGPALKKALKDFGRGNAYIQKVGAIS